MNSYLLSCDCGERHPVEPGQAGERVRCTCGAMLEVPPLRKMRHLPLATEGAAGPAVAASAWNARKGVVAALLLVAFVFALFAAWSWYTEPRVAEFDPKAFRAGVERGLETMTPEQSWHWWVEVYKPLAERGFAKIENPHASHIEAVALRHRFLQRTLLAAAAVFSTLAAAVAFWPSARAGRQREGETRRKR